MDDTNAERHPFAPKGDLPEWRLLYDRLLAAADFGDVVTYAALDETLGRPFVRNRSPLYRARREMGEQRKRWLKSVPRKGYRVIEATEHLQVADEHRHKARRQLAQMVLVGEVTDLSQLTGEQLASFDQQQRINQMQWLFNQHIYRRVAKVEAALRAAGLM